MREKLALIPEAETEAVKMGKQKTAAGTKAKPETPATANTEANTNKKASIRAKAKANGNGANLGFEAKLWLAADKLRNNMDAAEYKHVVLGLIFLKYISDSFEEMHQRLLADQGRRGRPGRRRRIPGRERLLGAEGGPLGASPGQGQAADHRQAGRRGDGRHRARQSHG